MAQYSEVLPSLEHLVHLMFIYRMTQQMADFLSGWKVP